MCSTSAVVGVVFLPLPPLTAGGSAGPEAMMSSGVRIGVPQSISNGVASTVRTVVLFHAASIDEM